MRRLFLALLLLALSAGSSFGQKSPLVGVNRGDIGIIGWASNVNVNATGDTKIAITAPGTSYIIGGIGANPTVSIYFYVAGCSGTATTFQAALYTGPNGTLQQLTPVSAYPLATTTTFMQKAGLTGTSFVFSKTSVPALYFRISTPQGSPMTCNILIRGATLP